MSDAGSVSMRIFFFCSLPGLAACSGASSTSGSTPSGGDDVPLWSTQDDDDDATSSSTPDPTVTTLPGGLHGTEPEEQLPAPTFASVLNRDGSPRSRDHLIGHPTVLWFYPAAATGG